MSPVRALALLMFAANVTAGTLYGIIAGEPVALAASAIGAACGLAILTFDG